jgi:DNA-nicking Smr family endonuclease
MARKIKSDEQALWKKVADTAIPIHTAMADPKPKIPKTVFKNSKLIVAKPTFPLFKVGSKSHLNGNPIRKEAPPSKTRMDSKSFGKLTRGKLRPEASLDLHGMSLSEAHPALQGFILGSAQLQRRLVLVITGKGKPKSDFSLTPGTQGILQRNVPIWLAQAPLSSVILEATPAHQRHGGDGAIYVYLRKRR